MFFFFYTTDIFRTWMYFLRVNSTFYDVIHDVIRTNNPFRYPAKFIFFGARNNKNSTNQTFKDKYNTYIVL